MHHTIPENAFIVSHFVCAVRSMCDNPYETISDSFYFVGDTLIMHNKAKYAYTENGALQ